MTASRNDRTRRALFVMLACALALPWLMPCTFGVGTIASTMIDNANQTTYHGSDILARLPNEQLKTWVKRPGPPLTIQSNAHIGHQYLLTDQEVNRTIGLPVTMLHRGTSSLASGISSILALSDLLTTHNGDYDFSSVKAEPRRELKICDSPYVLLNAREIRWGAKGGDKSSLQVRAVWRAKITIITPDGTFFGLAERIHFHAPSQEVILEGNPTVQSGHQHIKSDKPKALMKLNFATRMVTVEGKARETRF